MLLVLWSLVSLRAFLLLLEDEDEAGRDQILLPLLPPPLLPFHRIEVRAEGRRLALALTGSSCSHLLLPSRHDFEAAAPALLLLQSRPLLLPLVFSFLSSLSWLHLLPLLLLLLLLLLLSLLRLN